MTRRSFFAMLAALFVPQRKLSNGYLSINNVWIETGNEGMAIWSDGEPVNDAAKNWNEKQRLAA